MGQRAHAAPMSISLEAGRVTCRLLEGQMVLIKGPKFSRRFQLRGGGEAAGVSATRANLLN